MPRQKRLSLPFRLILGNRMWMRKRMPCCFKMLNSFGFHITMKKVSLDWKNAKYLHTKWWISTICQKTTFNFICMKSRTPILHSLFIASCTQHFQLFYLLLRFYFDFFFDFKSQLKISIKFWQPFQVHEILYIRVCTLRMDTKLPIFHWIDYGPDASLIFFHYKLELIWQSFF